MEHNTEKMNLMSYELWSTNSAILFPTAQFARRLVRIQAGIKTIPTELSSLFSVPPVQRRNRISGYTPSLPYLNFSVHYSHSQFDVARTGRGGKKYYHSCFLTKVPPSKPVRRPAIVINTIFFYFRQSIHVRVEVAYPKLCYARCLPHIFPFIIPSSVFILFFITQLFALLKGLADPIGRAV